nr:SH3 domain-containing protein 21-like [Vicugna pacos]
MASASLLKQQPGLNAATPGTYDSRPTPGRAPPPTNAPSDKPSPAFHWVTPESRETLGRPASLGGKVVTPGRSFPPAESPHHPIPSRPRLPRGTSLASPPSWLERVFHGLQIPAYKAGTRFWPGVLEHLKLAAEA